MLHVQVNTPRGHIATTVKMIWSFDLGLSHM